MVNRSDGVVSKVLIKGEVAWDGEAITEIVGKQQLGELLRSHKSIKKAVPLKTNSQPKKHTTKAEEYDEIQQL